MTHFAAAAHRHAAGIFSVSENPCQQEFSAWLYEIAAAADLRAELGGQGDLFEGLLASREFSPTDRIALENT